jgi:hypothetical protein
MSRDQIGFWEAFKKAFPFDRKEFFLGLIWPAAAGNVAWAFLQVALEREKYGSVYWPHLTTLALLAIYLAVDWLRTKERKKERETGDSSWYWIFDSLLVLSIVRFAIAIQLLPKEDCFLTWALGGVLTVAILGHLAGAWKRQDERDWPRFTLAACGSLGLIALVFTYYVCQMFPWKLVIPFGTVLILWLVVRTIEERCREA